MKFVKNLKDHPKSQSLNKSGYAEYNTLIFKQKWYKSALDELVTYIQQMLAFIMKNTETTGDQNYK